MQSTTPHAFEPWPVLIWVHLHFPARQSGYLLDCLIRLSLDDLPLALIGSLLASSALLVYGHVKMENTDRELAWRVSVGGLAEQVEVADVEAGLARSICERMETNEGWVLEAQSARGRPARPCAQRREDDDTLIDTAGWDVSRR